MYTTHLISDHRQREREREMSAWWNRRVVYSMALDQSTKDAFAASRKSSFILFCHENALHVFICGTRTLKQVLAAVLLLDASKLFVCGSIFHSVWHVYLRPLVYPQSVCISLVNSSSVYASVIVLLASSDDGGTNYKCQTTCLMAPRERSVSVCATVFTVVIPHPVLSSFIISTLQVLSITPKPFFLSVGPRWESLRSSKCWLGVRNVQEEKWNVLPNSPSESRILCLMRLGSPSQQSSSSFKYLSTMRKSDFELRL